MKKRLLSVLLILVMTLSLLPTAVLADEPVTSYYIFVHSPDNSKIVEITSANRTDVMDDGRVSYDPDSHELTLKDAHLGCIQVNGHNLTLNLVGNNTIIPSSENARAIIASGLSIRGEGSLHIRTIDVPAIVFLDTSLYRQSGGNVTLEGDVIWQDASGIELTGGTLTLGGAGLQSLPTLDVVDGTTLKIYDAAGMCNGTWTMPANSNSWVGQLPNMTRMELTAPAAIDEASLAELKEKETYYFDLSETNIRVFPNRNKKLPDATLHYVPFTYAGTLENTYRWKDKDTKEEGSWPLFISNFNIVQTSWNDLNTYGLIYGRSYLSGGAFYTLRAPSGLSTGNEWDRIKGYTIDSGSDSSWTQDFSINSPNEAIRRGGDPDIANPTSPDNSRIYYRPVLQPTNLNGQALRVVTFIVNGTSYNVITAEDTITPPSIDGLLNDGDELKNGYYWLNEADSKYYGSGSRIPVTGSMTLTAVPRGYGIIVTDKGGKEHLVTKDNHTDVLGDGTVSYEAGLIGYDPVLKLNNAKLRSIEYEGNLTLQLEGRSSIAARDKENAIYAGNLTIQGDGILSISAENGQAYKPLNGNCTYTQKSDHVTMPESALNQFERFSFSGGTLTLLGAETETFVNIDRCLKAGQIADGTELRLVNEDGVRVFSKKTPLEDPEDWDFLAINAVHAKKLHLIADGEELPPEIVEPEEPDEPKEPEEPEKPSIEPILIGGSVLLAGGDRNPFSDVRAIDWYYDDVMYAYDRGLIRGTAYNKFSPKDTFTRGMLLTILARHDGVRTKDSTPWYASGCDWAARNGISDGKNPEEAVSREEFALTLYRYAQYRGSNLLSGNSLSSFTDASAVSDAALPAVQWAVSEAILRGDNFYLHPQSGTTRAEAAAMLHRFFAR